MKSTSIAATKKQRSQANKEKRQRATYGYVPLRPPDWALPTANAWPLPARVKDSPDDAACQAFRQIQAAGYPQPEPEYQFFPNRKWMFDYAWPQLLLALEIEGLFGRHQTIVGMAGDCEKYSIAAIRGWKVIRATPAMVRDGTMMALLEMAFDALSTNRDTLTA